MGLGLGCGLGSSGRPSSGVAFRGDRIGENVQSAALGVGPAPPESESDWMVAGAGGCRRNAGTVGRALSPSLLLRGMASGIFPGLSESQFPPLKWRRGCPR